MADDRRSPGTKRADASTTGPWRSCRYCAGARSSGGPDADGRSCCRAGRPHQRLAVVGTIGILDLTSRRKLIDIGDAVALLKATNFRYRPSLLDALLTG